MKYTRQQFPGAWLLMCTVFTMEFSHSEDKSEIVVSPWKANMKLS